jgi:hypothetical protein
MAVRMCVIALFVAVAAPAHADQPDASSGGVEKGAFGIGLIIGEPTGISARLYLSDTTAVQAALGSAFIGGGLQIHADYVWHPWILEQREGFALVAYAGPGARLIYYDQGRDGSGFVAIGARGVGGIVFDFTEVPLDVFVEVAGVVEMRLGEGEDRGVGLGINAGAGARYYF